jgi:hypothetical protein
MGCCIGQSTPLLSPCLPALPLLTATWDRFPLEVNNSGLRVLIPLHCADVAF